MELHCRGCAGCCLDWRPLAPVADHERRGDHRPLDDVYNLVPLSRDDVLALVESGLAGAMTPRLWRAEGDGPSVEIDGYRIAAIEGRPVFFVGLRKVPKPVAPFDTDPAWLPSCVFLDPETLQCRVHDSEAYPEECASYPGYNLSLGAETECERVESHFGGDRLLDRTVPDDLEGPLFGPQALGQKVFAFPETATLDGLVDRFVRDDLTRADRIRFVAAAVASSPGTTTIEAERFRRVQADRSETDGWVEPAIAEWERRAQEDEPDPSTATAVETARGAPPTPGWGE